MMQVKLDDIPDVGFVVDAPVPVEFLDGLLPHTQDLHAEAPGHAKLRITRHEDNVLVDGEAQAPITGECASCLKPVHLTVRTKVGMMLLPTDAKKPKSTKSTKDTEDAEEVELSKDDDGVGEYSNKLINWGEVVGQHLLVALPIAPRCKEDCKGLCPVCGIDRNTETCACVTKQMDPRWDKLKQLKLDTRN